MREPDCEQEEAVSGAVTAGQWTPQLQAHVEGCGSCRDAVGVSNLLQKLVGEPKPHLPPSSYVWWQARMLQRREAQRRVTKLIAVTQSVMLAISLIGLGVWIILHRSEVGEEIRTSLNTFFAWSSSGLASGGVMLVYLSLALLVVNVLLTVRAALYNNKE